MTEIEVEQFNDNDLCYVTSQLLYSLLPPTRPAVADLENLLPGQRMLLATDIIEAQVSNGGFHQCYFNFGDEYIPLAIEGFRRMDANVCADVVSATWLIYRQARLHFDAVHQKVSERQSWQAFVDSYGSTELDKYDTPFYQARRSENLQALQAAYIRQHLHTEFPQLLTPHADKVLTEWRKWEASSDDPFNDP